MVKSVGKISTVLLSTTDTGTPEFVNRIYIPWLVRGREEGNKDIPSRVHLVHLVSPVSLRGVGSLTMPRLVRY